MYEDQGKLMGKVGAVRLDLNIVGHVGEQDSLQLPRYPGGHPQEARQGQRQV